jgi:uncharacterized membrane protein YoaK (UPF0700 family)
MSLGLAFLAGWVDAVGLIRTRDLFVSFMSGNTTHLFVALAGGASGPGRPAAVIGAFVCGVIAGELLAGSPERPRRPLVLIFEAGLLTAAWISTGLGEPLLLTCALLSVAMGAQNASVHGAAGVSMALTYVTGAFVRLGRGIAEALAGHGSWSKSAPYGGLILALAGAFAGTLALQSIGNGAIALAAAACLLIALWSMRLSATEDGAVESVRR